VRMSMIFMDRRPSGSANTRPWHIVPGWP
jgi:hypothetical protein